MDLSKRDFRPNGNSTRIQYLEPDGATVLDLVNVYFLVAFGFGDKININGFVVDNTVGIDYIGNPAQVFRVVDMHGVVDHRAARCQRENNIRLVEKWRVHFVEFLYRRSLHVVFVEIVEYGVDAAGVSRVIVNYNPVGC